MECVMARWRRAAWARMHCDERGFHGPLAFLCCSNRWFEKRAVESAPGKIIAQCGRTGNVYHATFDAGATSTRPQSDAVLSDSTRDERNQNQITSWTYFRSSSLLARHALGRCVGEQVNWKHCLRKTERGREEE